MQSNESFLGQIISCFTDDYTRVILSEYPGVPGSDYINANYIKVSFIIVLNFMIIVYFKWFLELEVIK